jgi:hypothetical protein
MSLASAFHEHDPDEYFKPVEPQRPAVYYFPNGLHERNLFLNLSEDYDSIDTKEETTAHKVVDLKICL